MTYFTIAVNNRSLGRRRPSSCAHWGLPSCESPCGALGGGRLLRRTFLFMSHEVRVSARQDAPPPLTCEARDPNIIILSLNSFSCTFSNTDQLKECGAWWAAMYPPPRFYEGLTFHCICVMHVHPPLPTRQSVFASISE